MGTNQQRFKHNKEMASDNAGVKFKLNKSRKQTVSVDTAALSNGSRYAAREPGEGTLNQSK